MRRLTSSSWEIERKPWSIRVEMIEEAAST